MMLFLTIRLGHLLIYLSQESPIGCKWVLRVKKNPDGTVSKYKARLVAKGFHQRLGYDYNETFTPVIKLVTVKIRLTLAITHKWKLQQLDVNNAFLNGILQEEVFMTQPPGFEASNKQTWNVMFGIFMTQPPGFDVNNAFLNGILRFLECEFRPNSIPKASSRGEDCPSLIYSNLSLGNRFFSSAAWPVLPLFPLPLMAYIAIFFCLKIPSTHLNLTQQN